MRIKFLGLLMSLVTVVLLLVGCVPPAKIEQFANIGEHQTAFLVPLEGATKSGQAKFMSVEYLNNAKVATKRVSLPLRKHKTGRGYWNFKYIPTMKVITVDRTPVTREWTGDEQTGTTRRNEALWVESMDSIGFGVGVNITALIKEEDAAKFLYFYAGRPLGKVVDENVRGKVNSVLSREFASYNLEEARKKKNDIFSKAADETIQDFEQFGVTITNLGLAEGMVYSNPKIQEFIDSVFEAEMKIQQEDKLVNAQTKTNTRLLSIAVNERKQAEEFSKAAEARKKQAEVEVALKLADAKLKWVEKWDGKLPEKILPEGSNLLMGLGDSRSSK